MSDIITLATPTQLHRRSKQTQSPTTKSTRAFVMLCAVAFSLALAVVTLGAFTRLADAGLGCPDWPTCYGHLWVPNEHHEIAAANEKFSATPVEVHKTWPEQLHRLLASSLGMVIFVLFIMACRRTQSPMRIAFSVALAILLASLFARIFLGAVMDIPVLLIFSGYFVLLSQRWRKYKGQATELCVTALLAGMVIAQGFFGMWTVTLKLWPQVVTAHLLGGFATLSVIWLLLQYCGFQYCAGWGWQRAGVTLSSGCLKNLRLLAGIALGCVILQVGLGGWTTSNYAALACPDFPRCQNQWWPAADFRHGFNMLQSVGPNYLGGQLEAEGRIAIHFAHRLGALGVTVAVLLLCGLLWRTGEPIVRRWSAMLIAALGLQISLGVSNVLLSLPLAVAVAHNAGGAVLLLMLVALNHRLWANNYGVNH